MRLRAVASAAALALATAAPAAEPAANAEVSGAPAPADAAPADPAAPPAAAASQAPATAVPPAAAPSPAATVPSAPAAARPPRASGPSQWGVLLGAGLPQGATLSAAYRPVPSLRLFAGPAWNYVGFGIQGGLAIAPWHFAATPVLTVEAGRYFGADVSFVTKGGQGIPPELSPLLKDMTYTYAAIHAGIELGSQNGFSFAIDLGLGYIALEAKGTVTKRDGSSTVTFKDPRLRATLPSLRLGLHYWF